MKPHLCMADFQLAQGVCVYVYQCAHDKWHKHNATAGVSMVARSLCNTPEQSSWSSGLHSPLDEIPSKLNTTEQLFQEHFLCEFITPQFNNAVLILLWSGSMQRALHKLLISPKLPWTHSFFLFTLRTWKKKQVLLNRQAEQDLRTVPSSETQIWAPHSFTMSCTDYNHNKFRHLQRWENLLHCLIHITRVWWIWWIHRRTKGVF